MSWVHIGEFSNPWAPSRHTPIRHVKYALHFTADRRPTGPDHCVESIRQSLTCNADTTAITYEWIPQGILQPQLGVLHSCRDFDAIREWAWGRNVPLRSLHAHVVDGRIVDTSDHPRPPVPPPGDFKYRVEDM